MELRKNNIDTTSCARKDFQADSLKCIARECPHLFFTKVTGKYTWNRFDSEYIVQETFLTAFDKFHQL